MGSDKGKGVDRGDSYTLLENVIPFAYLINQIFQALTKQWLWGIILSIAEYSIFHQIKTRYPDDQPIKHI